MLFLIFLLILGFSISFLSLQNTQLVSLRFLEYSLSDLPLYYVIIGAILTGISLAYVIYLFHAISTGLTIRAQKNQLKEEKMKNAEFIKTIHQLELENARLKKEYQPESIDQKSL